MRNVLKRGDELEVDNINKWETDVEELMKQKNKLITRMMGWHVRKMIQTKSGRI